MRRGSLILAAWDAGAPGEDLVAVERVDPVLGRALRHAYRVPGSSSQ